MGKWEDRYMALARHVAEWSQDPSTKVGAVVIGEDRRKIAFGYNGFPPGIRDDGRLLKRETKYQIIQHAERNAMDNATFDLTGATLATTFHPCHECAKSMITKGIKRVICPPNAGREEWRESFTVAADLLKEAGVILVLYEEPD